MNILTGEEHTLPKLVAYMSAFFAVPEGQTASTVTTSDDVDDEINTNEDDYIYK